LERQTEANEKKQSLKQRERELTQRHNELQHLREMAVTKKKEIMQALQKYDARRLKLESKRKDLVEALAKPGEDQIEITHAEQQLKRSILKRIELATQYRTILESEYIPTAMRRIETELELTQVKAEIEYFNRLYDDRTQALKEAQLEFDAADAAYKAAKMKAKSAFTMAKRAGDELREQVSPDESAQYAEVRISVELNTCTFKLIYLPTLLQLFQKFQNEEVEISLNQIEDEINSEQAKADALKAANPRAMQHYEQRLKEVYKEAKMISPFMKIVLLI
jgi:chromosome segregation ATPase